MEYLMLNQGRPVSQEELIEHVWDSTVNCFSNATRVHISSLRKKLRSALGYGPDSQSGFGGADVRGGWRMKGLSLRNGAL
ncbi:MAG: winged helix-turn-helix domain-containing protein [Collinsella sp.]